MIKQILLPMVLAATVSLGQAQTKISELLDQANASWLAGQWEARTGQGDLIQLRCWMDLDGTIGLMHLQAPGMELKSVSHLDPDTRDAKYLGFSLDGSISTGSWTEQYGNLLLNVESRHPSGRVWKAGVIYRRVNPQTMRIEIHELTATGNLVYPASQTIEFQRKP
jgi:hypothetical protein